MTEETLGTLRDFILTADQQTAPFTALRAVCLERLVEDRARRIRQAITDEELSGRPPSVFLRRLQQLMPAGSNEGSESVIRQLFLSRLPHEVQTALLPFEEKPLPELARLADRILALGESQLSASSVCATTHGVAARAVCSERLVEDRAQRIRPAITDLRPSGRPRSVFLRRLQQLMPAGSNDGSDPTTRQLFLSRLPHEVQTALLPFEEKPLPELARLADRILASRESQLSASPVYATTHRVAARLDDPEERVRQLTLHSSGAPRRLRSPDLTERCQQPRRSPSPGRSGRHVRRTYSPRGNSDIEQEAMCYYHRRFGRRARKCAPPCNWLNDSGARC
ncbi:hypothetical protein M513_10597 [Trichuris suis]|uniref:Uncharacterized protein n=1 Tax=Trichuris suis TaxID=68888 RepID=A0A085LU74_9BILA|nr:hypothetical protein M513_10597 [Trichuris suis]